MVNYYWCQVLWWILDAGIQVYTNIKQQIFKSTMVAFIPQQDASIQAIGFGLYKYK